MLPSRTEKDPLSARKCNRSKMEISIVCVGTLKEQYWVEAIREYEKRLSRYCSLSIQEVKEERTSANPSDAEEEKARIEEGKRILKLIREDAKVVVLDVRGKSLSSEGLASLIQEAGISGASKMAFVIGGSTGLSGEVLTRADLRLSFSAMTFPHQLMRVVLLEQIYRSFKIIKKEPYHK